MRGRDLPFPSDGAWLVALVTLVGAVPVVIFSLRWLDDGPEVTLLEAVLLLCIVSCRELRKMPARWLFGSSWVLGRVPLPALYSMRETPTAITLFGMRDLSLPPPGCTGTVPTQAQALGQGG